MRAVNCNVSYRMFTSNLPINSLRIVIMGGNKLLFASSFGSMLGSRIDWNSYSCRDFERLQKLGGEDAAKDRSASQTSEAHSISWDTDIFRYELEPRSPEALPQELQNCVSWTQGQTYLNKTVCIEGVVKYATSDGYQSYLFFTNNPIEFVVVSFDYSFPSVEGKCIRALGATLLINGTPSLILESPKQLAFCK
jgi:hypothetical protein